MLMIRAKLITPHSLKNVYFKKIYEILLRDPNYVEGVVI